MMGQFIDSPSLADTFGMKVLRALAKELDIKLTSSALKKKQIRDEIVVHLVNNELLDENALDTVDIGKEERSGPVNSELAIQMKQMEIDAKKEIEREQLALKEKLEQERVQKEIESKEKLERERVQKEIDAKKEIERERIQLERDIALKNVGQNDSSPHKRHSSFDPIKFSKVTPKFTGKDVDKFFEQYELVAKNFDFPSDKWTIMLQTVLTGKAAEVFLSLTSEQQKDYQTVKDVILRSYAMVPEQYRKSFREL